MVSVKHFSLLHVTDTQEGKEEKKWKKKESIYSATQNKAIKSGCPERGNTICRYWYKEKKKKYMGYI